jgi:DNA-binding NarL/FixJ family response regulator
MTTTPAELLIVDDHLLLAQGLAASLAARGLPHPRIVDPTRASVLSTVVQYRPDIVLLDVDFGDNRRAGLSLVEEIVETGCRVIMFTGINDDALYGRCLELGAEAVIRKCTALDAVVDDVERAMHGTTIGNDAEKFGWYRAFRAQQTKRASELAPFVALTHRESEVLALLVDGHTVEETAERTYVAVSTIRSHVRSIFQKLGVHSQLAAVALARRAQWQPPVITGGTVSR